VIGQLSPILFSLVHYVEVDAPDLTKMTVNFNCLSALSKT